MKHPLLVGYFDVNFRSLRPSVTKPIDLEQVRAILLVHCDKRADGSPVAAELNKEPPIPLPGAVGMWLGRIGQEDVHTKAGYLLCPWLSAGINKASVMFICDLYASLGVQIYDPSDARYVSPEALAEAEREFYEGI